MSGADMTAAAREGRTAIVARQNDQFRAMLACGYPSGIPGRVVITTGVAEKGLEFLVLLQLAVAGFADFNEDNDPYGDHTFGVVEVCGARVFWKIDLYDEHYRFGAENPENPETTRRVLTVLLPSEY